MPAQRWHELAGQSESYNRTGGKATKIDKLSTLYCLQQQTNGKKSEKGREFTDAIANTTDDEPV